MSTGSGAVVVPFGLEDDHRSGIALTMLLVAIIVNVKFSWTQSSSPETFDGLSLN